MMEGDKHQPEVPWTDGGWRPPAPPRCAQRRRGAKPVRSRGQPAPRPTAVRRPRRQTQPTPARRAAGRRGVPPSQAGALGRGGGGRAAARGHRPTLQELVSHTGDTEPDKSQYWLQANKLPGGDNTTPMLQHSQIILSISYGNQSRNTHRSSPHCLFIFGFQ